MATPPPSVLPEPVGAETITDWPAWIARMASSWKSSKGNGERAGDDWGGPAGGRGGAPHRVVSPAPPPGAPFAFSLTGGTPDRETTASVETISGKRVLVIDDEP